MSNSKLYELLCTCDGCGCYIRLGSYEKDVKKGFQFLLNYIYDYVSLPKVREDSTFNTTPESEQGYNVEKTKNE